VSTRLRSAAPDFGARLAKFCQGSNVPAEIGEAVAAILAAVRKRGDAAVAAYARRFDDAKFGPQQFRVPASELAEAAKTLPRDQMRALREAHAGILEYNRRGLPSGWMARNRQGGRAGEKFDPLRRVGLYIPGGEVPLVSTVLMTATLARIAGCPSIAAFTPTRGKGQVAPGLLAALAVVGVSEVYRIGGVQAIGAMAYGTATIPAVDKIFGPGNAYVCEAKRQVFGAVGVDSLPGPSEVMIIADGSANAAYAAADLLAQAEHGSGREKIFLVTLKPGIAAAVEAEIGRQMKLLGRSAKIERVLQTGFLIVDATSIAEAAAIANEVAPEHLQLMVAAGPAKQLTHAITTAGAIFIGNETPTSLGDFTAGPSHVLPTARAARFSSGLRVADFLRRTSIVQYDRASLKKAAPVVAAFAAMESLDAHGRSATIRSTAR
jgi:histidinol dehydrogenase